MGAYTIRELENLSGIKAHTIRIWEKRFKLIEPQRTSTNIRTYCDSELKKLLNISILNRNGLKISKIAQLTPDEIVQKVRQFTHEASNSESQIESLTVAMIDLDEYRFEQILARAIIQFGFEDMVIRILYPFFVKVGLLWQTGTINSVHEHFISNLVRQKFFSALDSLVGGERPGACNFVFFLPEGELHEIGLLFSCYLAKKRGHRVIYLGQSVPLSELHELIRAKPADYLFTSMITSFTGNDILPYVHALSETFIDHIVYITGSQVMHFEADLPSNIRILLSPEEFILELDHLHMETLQAGYDNLPHKPELPVTG